MVIGDLERELSERHRALVARGLGARVGFGSRPALLLVDLIRAFTDPVSDLGTELDDVVEASAELARAARAAGVPVLFAGTAYDPALEEAGVWAVKVPANRWLVAGEWTEPDPRLGPDAAASSFVKKYASAFFGTDLASRLVSRGVDTLVIAGVSTSGCVRATAVDACSLGLRVNVVREAVGDRAPVSHLVSLFDIDLKYGDVVPLADALAALAGEGGGMNRLYDYSPIAARPPLRWPGHAAVAFYVGLNVEHFTPGRPATSISQVTAQADPDPMNQGWRDYGLRVGIWRMIELFDALGLVPSVLLNSEVCEHYPAVVEAGLARDWCWLAHGWNNSELLVGLAPEEEEPKLTAMLETLERATGRRPRGWLGPGLSETHATPGFLRAHGIEYVLDWCADDQPFELNEPGLLSVPYSVEVNDITLYLGARVRPAEWEEVVLDQLAQLAADGAGTGRVMALPLHPFLVGQPFRHPALARVLEAVCAHPDVWVTTSDEIARFFRAAASLGELGFTAGQPQVAGTPADALERLGLEGERFGGARHAALLTEHGRADAFVDATGATALKLAAGSREALERLSAAL